jgi:hypothetical protein
MGTFVLQGSSTGRVNVGNMHVREYHENTQRNVTFYRYILEYMAT